MVEPSRTYRVDELAWHLNRLEVAYLLADKSSLMVLARF